MPFDLLLASSFDSTLVDIVVRLVAALGVGGLIGFERTYRGRRG